MGRISKNDEAFCDAYVKAWNGDKSTEKKVKIAIDAFMQKPQVLLKKKIQAIGVSTDFSILTKDAFNVTIEEDNFDLGWEKAFRSVTLGKRQDAWEIYNVTNGIAFQLVEEGQRIRQNGMAGTKTLAYVDYYGGAIGFTDKMIRFRKVPAMVDMAQAFRNKFWANKADNHYALILAGVGDTTTYQGAAADGQLQRDIQTINRAAFDLTDGLKDKGYGDMANARLVMYANPLDRARLGAAFRASTANIAPAGRTGDVIDYNIDVVFTFNSSISADTPILVLPGQKIQRADAMQPTTYRKPTDPLTLNEVQAVWAIYGATIADTDQIQAFELS